MKFWIFDYFYTYVSAVMKMLTSIIIMWAIYSNGYVGNIKWYILGFTIYWAFYPMIKKIILIKNKQEWEEEFK